MMGRILSKECITELEAFKQQGKKIVLCHGVFDLVHPGHIIHFEEAKKMGDILVVSVTSAKYVRKGPGRPYFNDEMRLKFLSAIACIDFVILSEGYTPDDMITAIKPDLYVKGEEYKRTKDDITGKIIEETALVRKYGGDIAYTTGEIFSSTRLINHAFPALSAEVKEFMAEFSQKYTLQDIRQFVERMKECKILVIGDAIIDEYIYCNVQGLMSKDMGYSARYKYEEQYLGGAMAIARHLASFNENIALMSVVGTQEVLHSRMLNELSDKMFVDMTYSSVFETIIKRRYVTLNEKREEVNKIFSINNLPVPMCIDEETMHIFKTKLQDKIGSYDAVILCDFGHGLIDHEVMEIVQKNAKFLAVNCQTNSSNYGKNLITKYTRADVFVLDQKELMLAFSDYSKETNEGELLLKLSEKFNSPGWLTQGSRGAIAAEKGELKVCPAFALKVKDTIGAGDAFFALASLSAAVGIPIEAGTFLGNIAGALAANIIGNKEAIEKMNVLKYASTLLNV